MLISATVVFGTIFLILYWYFTRNFDYWKKRNVPFIKPTPFIGNVIDGFTMRKSMGEVFADLYYSTKESMLGFFVLDRPCLLIRDPALLKKVLLTDFHHFFDRNIANNEKNDPIGTYILFALKNPDWKDIRAKITPVFTGAKLRRMTMSLEQSGEKLLDYLQNVIKTNNIVEVKTISQYYTIDVITSAVFGVNANTFKEESGFRTAAEKLFDYNDLITSLRFRIYFLSQKLVTLLGLSLINPSVTNFLRKSFEDIMDQRRKTQTTRNDLIDILLDLQKEGDFIKGDKLVAQGVMFFAAGFETTSSTMAFCLYELALQPDCQQKVREEVLQKWTKHGGCNYEALKEMEYLDMCFKETLRKWPSVAFLDRICAADYKVPDSDLVIEKGTSVFISLYGMQRDPQLFSNPEIFDPERFSKKYTSIDESFTYMPFGEGPRRCIGERFGMISAKTGLSYILKYFNVRVCDETQTKMKLTAKGTTLAPDGGIKLRFDPIA